jgi:chromosome segregation ATPase
MSENSTAVDSAVAQDAFASEVNHTAPVAQQAVAEEQFAQVKGYTETELVQKAREQEKSKLYPQIDSLKEEINLLKKDREERLAEARAAQEAAAEAERKKLEADMDVRTLLEQKEKEWASKIESERLERERAFALLEREREYAELTSYLNRRISEEQQNIAPELIDMIAGNNVEEIENSISKLKEKTSKLLEAMTQANQQVRREMTGTRTTLPPTLENNSDQQSYTPEQIASMSVADYAKNRSRLLGSAANDRNKGIFG